MLDDFCCSVTTRRNSTPGKCYFTDCDKTGIIRISDSLYLRADDFHILITSLFENVSIFKEELEYRSLTAVVALFA